VAYRRWLSTLAFDHPAQQIAFQDYVDAVADAERRLRRVEAQISGLLPGWSLHPIVDALQAMRGIALINAVVLVAEVGDFTRFSNPRQLMAYFGLVPGEQSSGETVRRGGITKTGNTHARRALVEGAWAYRMKPRVGRHKVDRIEALPKVIRDIGWKAQIRLCTRYRRLSARGKTANVIAVAIAREMVGFIWSIARTIQSAPKAVSS
jgi:transposase